MVVSGPPQPENARFLERMDARFADFLDYVTTAVNHSSQSVAWYRRAYAAYRKYVATGQTLDAVTFEAHALDIEEWVRTMRRDGQIKDVTIASYWRGVKRFFKDVSQRDDRASPFAGLKQPGFRDAAPKALDGTACLRVLDAARSYPWPLPHREFKRALGTAVVATMLYAGLRRGELVRLTLADVNGTTIRIIAGKGRFGGRDRAAYVSPDLQRILRDYLRERERLGVTAPELFVSPGANGPLTVDVLRKLLQRISAASGVPFSVRIPANVNAQIGNVNT